MKNNSKKAITIIEVMVSLLIIMVGLIWIYDIYGRSQKLAIATENRVKATSMAREVIEAMQNIRDTNFLIYSADPQNCWNTQGYSPLCLNAPGITHKIQSWSYIIYKDVDANRWKIEEKDPWDWDFSNEAYRNMFRVKLDDNWFYTQTWWTEFLPIFTRELIITYPQNDTMKISVLVSWKDSSRIWFSTYTLDSIITNWKES